MKCVSLELVLLAGVGLGATKEPYLDLDPLQTLLSVKKGGSAPYATFLTACMAFQILPTDGVVGVIPAG